ncbi:MerR family transcriptional regulator [Devosia sp.]|uniref:MerR family transcriptional regulator n=1 Tax=Devosia sp. TaxID=1871048 RepID=UPI003A928460
MQDYSIGQLATQTGVKVPTIRYYESIGILPEPGRTQGGQRRYDAAALERLRFIAHAREMGFPMPQLRAMLDISTEREAPCAELDALVEARLADVDTRIERLTRLRAELAGMLSHTHHGTVGECRVVEVLSDHEECAGAH